MDNHTVLVLLDAGWVLAVLFVFAVAATDAMIARIERKSNKVVAATNEMMKRRERNSYKFALTFAIVFGVFLFFMIYKLLSDLTSSYAAHSSVTADQATALGYLFGQLILPLILGSVFAFTNVRWLATFRAERRRLLKQLHMQSLADAHPEAAATVEELTKVLEKQGRIGLIQSIMLGAIFYLLGVVTSYIMGSMPR